MKKQKLFFLTAFLIAINSFYLFAQLPAAPSGTQWNIIEQDDFSGSNLNGNMWGTGSTPWGTENQSDCTWIAPSDTYLNGNGSLVLRSRKGPFTAPSGKKFDYTSGWAWTKQWHTYGYLEIRASYPNNRGAWPAFWMLRDGWPPEIDIAEYRGNPKGYMTQAYYDGSWYSSTKGGDYTGWHNYGLEWKKGSLKWYIDGQLVHSYSGSSVPTTAMYVILSAGTSCSDTNGTGFPNDYIIDYYRWYQTAPSSSDFNGTYEIVNRNSGKSLHTLNSATADGTKVIQYTRNGSASSKWTINRISTGVYNIINSASGKYADITGASTTAGANNIIWRNNGGNNQKWRITKKSNGYYSIVNVNSGLLLDITGASSTNNAENIQWTDNGGRNQEWSFNSVSSAKSASEKSVATNSLDEDTVEMMLYPNPSNNELNLKLPKEYRKDANIKIINELGQKVIETNSKNSDAVKISTTKLSKGIYFLKISNESNNKTLKFIKE